MKKNKTHKAQEKSVKIQIPRREKRGKSGQEGEGRSMEKRQNTEERKWSLASSGRGRHALWRLRYWVRVGKKIGELSCVSNRTTAEQRKKANT